jgi:hypothetical protein
VGWQKQSKKEKYFRDTKSCYDRVVTAQRERAMAEQVFEKVHDCGQVFSVLGLFGGSLLGHGRVSGTHCVYDVYISDLFNCNAVNMIVISHIFHGEFLLKKK